MEDAHQGPVSLYPARLLSTPPRDGTSTLSPNATKRDPTQNIVIFRTCRENGLSKMRNLLGILATFSLSFFAFPCCFSMGLKGVLASLALEEQHLP